jgi:sortase (surface protein transpeptidase)
MHNQRRNYLDNPAFTGRLRQPSRRIVDSKQRYEHDCVIRAARSSQRESKPPAMPSLDIIKPQPLTKPGRPRQQSSSVLKRQAVQVPEASTSNKVKSRFSWRRYSKLQLSLYGMACIVFVLGVVASLQTLQTNYNATAQVSALSKKTSHTSVPDATKPSSQAISSYVVAPDLPRYIKIPKLHTFARVMQVGVDSSGALGTPGNIYDTAWYTGSAKPGQPGTTLIDGHVSSWTSHGVFYGIKSLVAGDNIQIVRGDGAILNYKVVKTQVYPDNNVDMKAAITPITPGKAGLNLITCTGKVKPGTSQFNQRVIVFAEQEP